MSTTSDQPNPAAQVRAGMMALGEMQAPADGSGSLLNSPSTLTVEATSLLTVSQRQSASTVAEALGCMLDAMPHPAWLADEDGDVRRVNPRMLALLDESEGNLFRAGWLQCLHAEDRPTAAVQWRASVASGLSFLVRVRLRLGDGAYRWHSASAKRFHWAAGRMAWLGTFTDIHDLVCAEEAKQASQRRFEATLVDAPVGVAYTSGEGKFTYANAEFCRLLGYTRDELRCLTWQAITHPDDLEADLELGRAVLEGRQPFYLMDKRYIRKDGQPLYIRLFGNFIRDANGEVIEGLAVVLDLSDRRRVDLLREEVARRRDEFLRMLAHELRNPLGPIRNSAALLARHPHSEKVSARAAKIIERQTAHLASLLDSLLDVARVTRGGITLKRCPCDLFDIVAQVVQDHRDGAAARGLILSGAPSVGPLPLYADPVRVAQAIGNLIDNALRFTESGSVRVVCDKDPADEMAVCRVIDTGCGMDARTQARLFEPFAQAEQGIDRAKGGLGVGLMIVKAIVDLHGGHAKGHSDGAGKGSIFELQWPIAKNLGAQDSR